MQREMDLVAYDKKRRAIYDHFTKLRPGARSAMSYDLRIQGNYITNIINGRVIHEEHLERFEEWLKDHADEYSRRAPSQASRYRRT